MKGAREEEGAEGGMMTGWWLLFGGRMGMRANLHDCRAAMLTWWKNKKNNIIFSNLIIILFILLISKV